MVRANRDRLHVLALGAALGAIAYHLSLTGGGLLGAYRRR